MALGYTIATILKRSSHVFSNDRVCVKIDWLEQLNRRYVQALPDDLKTKLSIDEDLVSSPKEALSRASADRVAMRNKNLKSGFSHSYTTQGDKNLAKLTRVAGRNRRYERRTPEAPAMLASQITHISRAQRQIMHQLDNLSNLLHESIGELIQQKRNDRAIITIDFDFLRHPHLLALAMGGIGVILLTGLRKN